MNINLEKNANKDLPNEYPTWSNVDEDGYCALHVLPLDEEQLRKQVQQFFKEIGW